MVLERYVLGATFFTFCWNFNLKITIFRPLWVPLGATNIGICSFLFLSWGPLGTKVAQEPFPRASGSQF